jgi:dGTPase
MNKREEYQILEAHNLSSKATLSKESMGRQFDEEECDYRTVFQRDRDRIIHCKAFRRLEHKTQVFIAPSGDHYRTRLTHTLEVSQISRTIARNLRLNEDLTEAIALGHDLGHTPFGHTGEKVLNKVHSFGFKHNIQSLRVVDSLERRNFKRGLNLTYEVRDGILNHTGDNVANTLEGQIVNISDRIAYINHDIDDAIRAEVLSIEDIPKKILNVLGYSHGHRINTLISDVIRNSENKDIIKQSDAIKEVMLKLREFMFKNVYFNKVAKKEEKKAAHVIKELYKYYLEFPDELPEEYRDNEVSSEVNICDYIAGMTDRYAINVYSELFVPKPWRKN